MKNGKLGKEPAMPSLEYRYSQYSGQPSIYSSNGMSKRFYVATKILQGFASDPNVYNTETIVELAYKWADELLKQEDL